MQSLVIASLNSHCQFQGGYYDGPTIFFPSNEALIKMVQEHVNDYPGFRRLCLEYMTFDMRRLRGIEVVHRDVSGKIRLSVLTGSEGRKLHWNSDLMCWTYFWSEDHPTLVPVP
jgi:hypothetical protein